MRKPKRRHVGIHDLEERIAAAKNGDVDEARLLLSIFILQVDAQGAPSPALAKYLADAFRQYLESQAALSAARAAEASQRARIEAEVRREVERELNAKPKAAASTDTAAEGGRGKAGGGHPSLEQLLHLRPGLRGNPNRDAVEDRRDLIALARSLMEAEIGRPWPPSGDVPKIGPPQPPLGEVDAAAARLGAVSVEALSKKLRSQSPEGKDQVSDESIRKAVHAAREELYDDLATRCLLELHAVGRRNGVPVGELEAYARRERDLKAAEWKATHKRGPKTAGDQRKRGSRSR